MLTDCVINFLKAEFDKLDLGQGIPPIECIVVLRAAGLNVTAKEIHSIYKRIDSPLVMYFDHVVLMAEQVYFNSVRAIVFMYALEAAVRIFEDNALWDDKIKAHLLFRSRIEQLAKEEQYSFPKELIKRISHYGKLEDERITLNMLMTDIMDRRTLDVN